MFDPEKVERHYVKEWGHHGVYVSDYDQLLELYRVATKPLVDGKDFCIIGGEVVINPQRGI